MGKTFVFLYECGWFRIPKRLKPFESLCIRATMTVPHKYTDTLTSSSSTSSHRTHLCMNACPMKCQTFAFYQLLLFIHVNWDMHTTKCDVYLFLLTLFISNSYILNASTLFTFKIISVACKSCCSFLIL